MHRLLSAVFSYARAIFPSIFLSFSPPAFVLDISSRYTKYSKPVRLSFPLTICEFSDRSLRCSLPPLKAK